MKRFCCFFLVMFLALPFASTALAAYNFTDDRFAGIFTTENLNAIIEEYELYDGCPTRRIRADGVNVLVLPSSSVICSPVNRIPTKTGNATIPWKLPAVFASVTSCVWNTVPIK